MMWMARFRIGKKGMEMRDGSGRKRYMRRGGWSSRPAQQTGGRCAGVFPNGRVPDPPRYRPQPAHSPHSEKREVKK
ncbi:hypothetical protein E2C01_034303 [Portunus trituberculatus]|uniref:Uncharacterized protein n=1 Tax=Portunus trituberculatus TaxID=210409 RepID=A0A5B7F5D9_PORTR|nr:hypothetical protein [Portunus trituberculatus]